MSNSRQQSSTNVFACLVHEAPDCVADLVRNLRCLDPESSVLLYDGSRGRELLASVRPLDEQVRVVPGPRQMYWGRLHDFALDCMRFALRTMRFDVITIVDSDQLLLGPGYSDRLREMLADHPSAGCFGTHGGPVGRGTHVYPAQQALAEGDRWLPYLDEHFPGAADLFPHWTFWPTTVFTREACRRLTDAWADPELQRLADASQITATEEVLLPTLTALTGLDVVQTPLRQDVVTYRRPHSVNDVRRMAEHPDAYWVHPVPRVLDDPLRTWLRERHHGYVHRVAGDHPGPDAAAIPPGMVSALMITGDQPLETTFAVRHFQAQDVADRELVVVDDGDRPVEELLRDVPGAVYVRPALRTTRAASRNLAAAHARGEFFAHWDVSGWNRPTRLSDALRALSDADADLCGHRAFLGYEPASRTAWRYEYPRFRRRWLVDGTLVYRRGIWDTEPYSEITPDAQLGYYWPARARHAVTLDGDPPVLVTLATPPQADEWWERLPGDTLADTLGPDWPQYEATRVAR